MVRSSLPYRTWFVSLLASAGWNFGIVALVITIQDWILASWLCPLSSDPGKAKESQYPIALPIVVYVVVFGFLGNAFAASSQLSLRHGICKQKIKLEKTE